MQPRINLWWELVPPKARTEACAGTTLQGGSQQGKDVPIVVAAHTQAVDSMASQVRQGSHHLRMDLHRGARNALRAPTQDKLRATLGGGLPEDQTQAQREEMERLALRGMDILWTRARKTQSTYGKRVAWRDFSAWPIASALRPRARALDRRSWLASPTPRHLRSWWMPCSGSTSASTSDLRS